jgi:hypothetical protein
MRERKDTWTALGIAGLAVLMMCGTVEAQESSSLNPAANNAARRAGEPPTQPPLEANRGSAPSAQAAGGGGDLAQSVARLRSEVAQLRAELAQVRAELAAQGVGGSGAAGQAGTGAAGTLQPPEEVTGTSVATAIYSGTVQEVGPQALILADEAGTLLTLDIDGNTQVLRNGKRMDIGQLQRGTRVRASVDLLSDGRNEAVEILVQPPAR